MAAFLLANEKEHATTVEMLKTLVTSQESNRQNHAVLQKLLQSSARNNAAYVEELRAIVEQKKLQASLSDSLSVDTAIEELEEAGFSRGSSHVFSAVADVRRREPQGTVKAKIAAAQSFLSKYGYPANINQQAAVRVICQQLHNNAVRRCYF